MAISREKTIGSGIEGTPLLEPIAIGSTLESGTAAEWRRWLDETLPNFEGNVGNAAEMMAALSEGRNYIYGKLARRSLGGKEIKKPNLVVVLQESSVSSPIASINKGEAIGVKKSCLEEFSQFDKEDILTIVRADGEISLQGRVVDMFGLAGVEEAHHAIFNQVKPGTPASKNPLSMTQGEYDAREVEYRALKWQLRYARECGMPRITIETLKQRLDVAAVTRKYPRS